MTSRRSEHEIVEHAEKISRSLSKKKPKTYRAQKLPELLRHLAADFIQRESNGTSLVTVTRADISPSKKRVIIFFTVLPEEKETSVMELLLRRKRDFMEFIDNNARIGRMPEIQFSVDIGEKNRQKIDFLLSND